MKVELVIILARSLPSVKFCMIYELELELTFMSYITTPRLRTSIINRFINHRLFCSVWKAFMQNSFAKINIKPQSSFSKPFRTHCERKGQNPLSNRATLWRRAISITSVSPSSSLFNGLLTLKVRWHIPRYELNFRAGGKNLCHATL